MTDFFAPRPTALVEIFPELADRERDVLGLIAQRHDNTTIARQLVISPQTACNYVSNI